MDLQTWFAFASATFVLSVIPGPSVLVVTAASVAGVVLGGYALLAARLRRHISSSSAQQKASGVSGALYIVGGAFVAVTR